MRKAIVEKKDSPLSIRRQCVLLGINRNRLEIRPKEVTEDDLSVTRRMDEIALRFPEFGSRRHALALQREGHPIGRDKVRGLMKLMGLRATYRRPRTSTPGTGHRNLSIPAPGP